MVWNAMNNGNNWRDKLMMLMEQEEYTHYLEYLSDVIQDHGQEVDAELMYNGAYAYFMLGDYERATNWADSTLNMDEGHLKVRILLGRICILEERTEDALALFEFVLEHGEGKITQDEKEDIEVISSYYARKDESHIKEAYPHLAVLLGFLPPSVLTQRQANKNFLLDKSQAVPSATDDAVSLAEKQMKDILGQKISLRDKIRLLETTAGGYYMEGMTEIAERLLAAALTLDPLDDSLLRNMAIAQMEQGHREKALRFAAQMQKVDFLLLRVLKG